MSNTSYLSYFYRSCFAEDLRYQKEILNRAVHVLYRPGDRSTKSNPRYILAINGVSYIAFILRYGSHKLKKPPKLFNPIPIIITKRTVVKIRDIPVNGLHLSYSEIINRTTLIKYLSNKYPEEKLHLDSYVTEHHFQYCKTKPKNDFNLT